MKKTTAVSREKITIPFSSIQLTSKCNLACGFCYRKLNVPDLPFTQIEKIIKQLARYHAKTLVLSGGEPILRKDIKKILKITHSLGIKTVLQSNGMILAKRLTKLAPYLDWVSLSLDGYDEDTNAVMRGKGHFSKLIKTLHLIKKYDIKIKLGTVITKKNYKNIIEIGDLVGPYVSTWKLYQFYPREKTNAQKNKDEFMVTKGLFKKTVDAVKEKFPLLPIASHEISEFNKSPCLLIDPDGKVYATKNNKDYLIGDILNDPDNFIKNYKKQNIFKEIENNFNKTYKD